MCAVGCRKALELAVHTERSVQPSDVLASLKELFEFVRWIDSCYGFDYQERVFDESLIPTEKVTVDTRKIKEQESLLGEKKQRSRQCVNKLNRCQPNILLRKKSISGSNLYSRKICLNARRGKFTLM